MKMDAVSHFLDKTIYSKNKRLDHLMCSLANFFCFLNLLCPMLYFKMYVVLVKKIRLFPKTSMQWMQLVLRICKGN